MDISVVIPLLNEDESLPELAAWIRRVMEENKFSYEIIMVDDGSTDNSWQVITELRKQDPNLKGIRFFTNYGKSAALNTAFAQVQGNVVITMDADLQDSPDEIPGLYKMIVEEGYDLVSGWKKKRYDPLSKTIPTKIYNFFTRKLSGINNLHDFNCGLKSYRKDVIKCIEVYGEMHRYLPVIAKYAGFKKIGEKVVQHQARKYGVTKFGLSRFVRGPLDLLSISFMSRYMKRPMHFFGFWGAISALGGGGILIFLAVMKVLNLTGVIASGNSLGSRIPLLFFSTAAFLMGLILFVTGLLAELIGRNSAVRNNYSIAEVQGFEEVGETGESKAG